MKQWLHRGSTDNGSFRVPSDCGFAARLGDAINCVFLCVAGTRISSFVYCSTRRHSFQHFTLRDVQVDHPCRLDLYGAGFSKPCHNSQPNRALRTKRDRASISRSRTDV